MRKISSYNTQGFTLVELSIVLVIIGLLVGGILVGQSLIESAKISGTVQQIQQFDAGVMAFKTKYKGIPGDSKSFGGDGDGKITMGANVGWQTATNSYAGEIANFWNNMSPTQYAGTPHANPGTPPKPTGAGKNVPTSKMGQSGAYFIASASGIWAVDSMNWYIIMGAGGIPTGLTNTWYQISPKFPAVKPSEALSLDQKIDDAKATTGSIIAATFGGAAHLTAPGDGYPEKTSTYPNCTNGDTYLTSNNSYECTPFIRIGGQAGMPL